MGPFGEHHTRGPSLNHQRCAPGPFLAAMDRRLRAPLGGEAADADVDFSVEVEKVADDASIEESAVGVVVGEISRL